MGIQYVTEIHPYYASIILCCDQFDNLGDPFDMNFLFEIIP